MSDATLLNAAIDPKADNLSNAQKTLLGSIEELKAGYVGAHWQQEVIEAARLIYQDDKALFATLRAAIKSAHKEAQITEWFREIKQASDSGDDASHADELVELVQAVADLFHDEQGGCYATFEQGGHKETWLLGSKGFWEWLEYKAYSECQFTPGETAMKAAISTLRGIAKHEGDEHPVYLRCAPYGEGYCIDLTDEQWRCVCVDPTGWRVVDESPVRFIRSATATAMLAPTRGNLSLLWDHVNIPRPQRTLILAFMLECWRPELPYTILELSGSQGSVKSTTHKRIRQLTDTNAIPLRSAPKDVQDVYVAAGNNHQASFENMSSLSPKMQDALCTLATGGGFASRKLFSDADENVIEVKRPVIINGISPVATRPDLIDRVVHIDLPRIDTYAREKELDAAFERDRPAISAGLFDLFSKALKELPGIEIEKPPRMADFGFLGEAIHRALDIEHRTFVDCYRENRADSLTRSIDTSPAALAVLDMMEKREKWSGTVKQLKAELDDYHKQYGEGWPQSPRGLADILRRMSPAMKESGVEVDFSARRRDGVHVTLKRTFFFEQYLESEKHVHKDHMFTQKELNGTKREEKDMKCEHVNMVNVFSGSKIMPEKKDAPKTDNHSEVVI